MAKMQAADVVGRPYNEVLTEQKERGMKTAQLKTSLQMAELAWCDECGLIRPLSELGETPDVDIESKRVRLTCK